MASSSSPHKAGRKSKPGKPVQSFSRLLSSRTEKPSTVIAVKQECGRSVLKHSSLTTSHSSLFYSLVTVSMNRWEQINRLYDAALEVAEVERPAFLEQKCNGDEELRREVESLLAYDQQA